MKLMGLCLLVSVSAGLASADDNPQRKQPHASDPAHGENESVSRNYRLSKAGKEYLGFRPVGSKNAFLTCDAALIVIGTGTLTETEERCPDEPSTLNIAHFRSLEVGGVRGGVIEFQAFTDTFPSVGATASGPFGGYPVVAARLDTSTGIWTMNVSHGEKATMTLRKTTGYDAAIRAALKSDKFSKGDLVLVDVTGGDELEVVGVAKEAARHD